MSSDPKGLDVTGGFSRRDFVKAGAAGAAAIAAAGLGMSTAAAAPTPPPEAGGKLRTNSNTGIRTAIVTDTQLSIGPYLAEEFARRKYLSLIHI